MATSLTSDAFHDFPCTSCAAEDINKEADVLCVTCNQYLCKTCLRFHNRVAGAKDHQFIDKDQFGHVTTASSQTGKPDLPTEICTKHHGKLIDMFCEDHDVVGCSVCMALDHRSCKDLFYIPDIAGSRVSDQNVRNLQQDLSNQIDKTKCLKENRQKHISRLHDEKDTALNEVRERRKVIDECLDKQENAIYSEITDAHVKASDKLSDDIDVCADCIARLETVDENIKKTVTNNTSQTFVNIKRAERLIQETELKRFKCNGNGNNLPSIVFEVGNTVDEVMSHGLVFGRMTSCDKLPIGLKHMDTLNMRYDKDVNTCGCCDWCELSDGTIILTDWYNKNVKSLKCSPTCSPADSLQMPSNPWGICCVHDNEVVVTMPNLKTVSFISVNDSLAIKNSFKVDGNCYGIVYDQGLLYIGQHLPPKVTVFDLGGKIMSKISLDRTGSAIFEKPLHLCVWPGKQYIVVADASKGVVVVDKLDGCVARYMHPSMKHTFGVCFDEYSNMIISDSETKEIIVVSGIDKDTINTTHTLLTTTNKQLRSVHFQRSSIRLLVTYANCNHIDLFTLVY